MSVSPEDHYKITSTEGVEDALENLEQKFRKILDTLYSDLSSLHFRLLELEEHSKHRIPAILETGGSILMVEQDKQDQALQLLDLPLSQ